MVIHKPVKNKTLIERARLGHLYLIIAFISLLPVSADGGLIETSTRMQVMTTPDGAIHVNGSIFNTGNETVYESAVEVLMAGKQYPTVQLGDNPPGGALNVDYKIAGVDLKPGHYILVVSINFEDLSGRRHHAYRFLPLNYRIDDDDKDNPGISLRLNSPRFNLRSPFRQSDKLKLTLENETEKTIESTLALYLPDGLKCAQRSIQTFLLPGAKKEKEVNIQVDSSTTAGSRIAAVVWWELNGRVYSIIVESEMVIVQEPLLFQWYLAFSTILLSFVAWRAVLKHHWNQRSA